MIIKAIIVDDDQQSRELIYSFCKTYSDDKIEVLELCHSVDNAIIAIEKHNPDLIFLDIDMPEKNGFELVKHFCNRPFEIVFVTGHENYQTEAIACSAMNYIMKPINPLSLKSIIDQFDLKIFQKNDVNRLEILQNNLTNEQKTIVFSNNDGFKVALASDIFSCETENGNGKCKIETTKETIIITKSLKEVFKLLPENMFLKISASAMINKKFVHSFNSKDKKIILTNGAQITVTEFNKKELMNALQN